MRKSYLFLVLLFVVTTVSAQTTKYVTDETKVPVRTGKSTNNKILKLISSGDAVTVTEETSDGYSRVQLQDGVSGWMLSRYLMDIPSGRDRYQTLQGQYEALQKDKLSIQKELDALASYKQKLEKQNEQLLKENAALNKSLGDLRTAAARPIQIAEENNELRERLNSERDTNQKLVQKNIVLKENVKRDWFMVGAGVSLGSLLFGLLIPRIPWRKRRSWGEL